ncbi:MAG: hypothetical protein R3F29_15300 [Planctomycetota bacterium]
MLDDARGCWVELWLRRYRCTSCGATCTVGPAEVVPRCRYVRSAIAMALIAWAHGSSAAAVRAQVCPDVVRSHDAERDWPSLRRWVRRARRLFGPRCPVAGNTPRAVAARIARWILAHAPPDTTGAPRSVRAAHAVRALVF